MIAAVSSPAPLPPASSSSPLPPELEQRAPWPSGGLNPGWGRGGRQRGRRLRIPPAPPLGCSWKDDYRAMSSVAFNDAHLLTMNHAVWLKLGSYLSFWLIGTIFANPSSSSLQMPSYNHPNTNRHITDETQKNKHLFVREGTSAMQRTVRTWPGPL